MGAWLASSKWQRVYLGCEKMYMIVVVVEEGANDVVFADGMW